MDHKFRAWAVNEKRWIDEDELHLLIPFFSGYEIMQDYPHAYVLMEETCDPGDDGIEKVLEIKWIPFTGCKDKNGKEIYEGDVVHHVYYLEHGQWGERKDGGNCVVEWDKEQAAFRPFYHWSVYTEQMKSCEVIGNIYENPELLTRKEQK